MLQIFAERERILSQLGQRFRQGDLLQRRALGKCRTADLGQLAGQTERFQTLTLGKHTICNALDAVVQFDILQAGAASKDATMLTAVHVRSAEDAYTVQRCAVIECSHSDALDRCRDNDVLQPGIGKGRFFNYIHTACLQIYRDQLRAVPECLLADHGRLFR